LADLTQLQADRDAVYAAKIQFLQGNQVKQVERGGRKLVFANAGAADFDAAIAKLDAEIAAAQADAAGTRRRRAFTLGFH
jgi:hypothetical protein